MAKKQTDFTTEENKGLPVRQKNEILNDRLYYFEDHLEIEGVLEANVITSTGWLLELLK